MANACEFKFYPHLLESACVLSQSHKWRCGALKSTPYPMIARLLSRQCLFTSPAQPSQHVRQRRITRLSPQAATCKLHLHLPGAAELILHRPFFLARRTTPQEDFTLLLLDRVLIHSRQGRWDRGWWIRSHAAIVARRSKQRRRNV